MHTDPCTQRSKPQLATKLLLITPGPFHFEDGIALFHPPFDNAHWIGEPRIVESQSRRRRQIPHLPQRHQRQDFGDGVVDDPFHLLVTPVDESSGVGTWPRPSRLLGAKVLEEAAMGEFHLKELFGDAHVGKSLVRLHLFHHLRFQLEYVLGEGIPAFGAFVAAVDRLAFGEVILDHGLRPSLPHLLR